mmetsp:Transcript_41991/g.110613  ORF Transcript_41991/g.110613 Transcript_41991/m.110613 type:complete len:82 (+) Transcript_41991:74-319(+)
MQTVPRESAQTLSWRALFDASLPWLLTCFVAKIERRVVVFSWVRMVACGALLPAAWPACLLRAMPCFRAVRWAGLGWAGLG